MYVDTNPWEYYLAVKELLIWENQSMNRHFRVHMQRISCETGFTKMPAADKKYSREYLR